MQVRKVGQVLHIECKFEMTIYPQNLRYAACFMQNSDDLSSLKREIAIFLSISPPWFATTPTTTSIPTPTRGGGGSHHLSSWHRQSRSMTCEDRARSSTRVVMKKVNPTDNFVVSRILHYPIPFFALGSSAKRQSARAFVYCETRRGHTHFLPLPLLPGFLITPHKTFNEISEDGRVKIIKTF